MKESDIAYCVCHLEDAMTMVLERKAMLNKGLKNKKYKKDPLEKVYKSMSGLWRLLSRPNLSNRKVSHTYRPTPIQQKCLKLVWYVNIVNFSPSPIRVVRGRIGQGHPRLFVLGHIDRGRNDLVSFGIPTVPWNGKVSRCPVGPSLPFPLAPRPPNF